MVPVAESAGFGSDASGGLAARPPAPSSPGVAAIATARSHTRNISAVPQSQVVCQERAVFGATTGAAVPGNSAERAAIAPQRGGTALPLRPIRRAAGDNDGRDDGLTDYLWFNTSKRREVVRITDDVASIVSKSGVRGGHGARARRCTSRPASMSTTGRDGLIARHAGLAREARARRSAAQASSDRRGQRGRAPEAHAASGIR